MSLSDCMNEVAAKLKYYHPANIVIDPVMYAKNDCPLMESCTIVQPPITACSTASPKVLVLMSIRSVTRYKE